MKFPLGHVTTSTAYWGGAAYVTQERNFNVFGASMGESYTIPSGEGLLAGTYTFNHVYSTNTGLLLKDVFPSAGGLSGETVNHGYDAGTDLPETLGGLADYTDNTLYDAYGRITQEVLGADPNQAILTNQWDPHSGRLKDQLVTRKVATPTNVDEQTYYYDKVGNVTRQASTRLGAATPTETQCYRYDGLNRLSAAWTATDDCTATPTTASHATVGDSLGSASAYWTTWGFDPPGQRTSHLDSMGQIPTWRQYTRTARCAGQRSPRPTITGSSTNLRTPPLVYRKSGPATTTR